MKASWHRKILKSFLVILAISGGVIAILFAAMKIYYWNVRQDLFRDERAAMASAKELWVETDIQSYQIRIQRWLQDLVTGDELWLCEIEYTVENQIITQIIEEPNCEWDISPLTVEDLFDRASDYLSPDNCGINGCVCDGPIDTTITFSEAYGYPELILPLDLMETERWHYNDIRIFSPKWCYIVGTLTEGDRVISFAPLK